MSMRQYFNNFLTLLKIGESGGKATFSGAQIGTAETVTTMGTLINGAGAITTPGDTDRIVIRDNASGLLAYVSFANIKATLLAWLINILMGRTDLVATNGSTMTLNVASCSNFKIDASGFTGGTYTIAVANQSAANVTAITLIIVTGAATLPTVIWPSGAAYTLIASKTHLLTLVSVNGTVWHVLEAKVY